MTALDATPAGMQAASAAATRNTADTAPGSAATFAVTFGIAFAVAYTVLERLNWPLFTYHPVSGAVAWWRQSEGVGPPMFWYGWIVLAGAAALAAAFAATRLPRRWLHRATVFACALAVLWPAALAGLRIFVTSWARFDAGGLDNASVAAMPALAGAVAATVLLARAAGGRLLARVWTGLLVIAPLGGLAVLGWSLLPYVLR